VPLPYALLRLPAEAGNRRSAGGDDRLRALARAHPLALEAAHRSRSYCGELALVAWHSAPVGVDLERVREADADFAASICTPAEQRRFAARLGDAAFVTSLWSSKEAVAKALGDAVAYDPRRLESPMGWLEGACGSWRALELHPEPGYVAWLVWSRPAQNSAASAVSAASSRRAAGRR
jgi:phosphopantetheinyl transferase